MVSSPGQKAVGQPVNGIVEYLDLMPTLLSLALGKARPNEAAPAGMEGRSFSHLLDDPSAAHRDLGFYQ